MTWGVISFSFNRGAWYLTDQFGQVWEIRKRDDPKSPIEMWPLGKWPPVDREKDTVVISVSENGDVEDDRDSIQRRSASKRRPRPRRRG